MPNSRNSAVPRQSLTGEQWAQAALDAMVDGGIDGVAVEPLARTLNVTKGSFYWHFENREALLKAALDLWERNETEDVIRRVDLEPDAYQRIVKLFKQAHTSYRSGRLYLAIAAAEDHPVVSRAVRRVSQRRMDYLYSCYEALGFDPDLARHWARFAYATFMGNLQISRDTPDQMPAGQEFAEYFHLMIHALVPGAADHPHVVRMQRKES